MRVLRKGLWKLVTCKRVLRRVILRGLVWVFEDIAVCIGRREFERENILYPYMFHKATVDSWECSLAQWS
jgi:hypothetical protein